MITTFRGVVLEIAKYKHNPYRAKNRARVRPVQGRKALKTVLDAMQAGNSVAMQTYYDEGTEIMDAVIAWDAQ